MIDLCLEQLGFTDREIRILLSLVEGGEAGAQDLSRRTGIPRTSVYTVIETLLSRELIIPVSNSSIGGGQATYRIAAPSAFRAVIDHEKETVLKREKAADHLVALLQPLFVESNSGVPRIRFFSGKADIEKMLFSHYQSWRKSMKQYDFTWWGHQDNTFVTQYQTWFSQAWQDTEVKELVHLFSNWSKEEAALAGKVRNRFIKPVPPDFKISSTLWVVGDFIVMIASQQKPHYAFEMIDSVLAANLRQMFQFLWQVTPKLVMTKKV